MKTFRLFSIALTISYITVCSFGALLLIRPWESDSAEVLAQRPDIVSAIFLTFQIPGLLAVAWLMQPSVIEMAILGMGLYLGIATWRNLSDTSDPSKLRSLSKLTFWTFFGAIALRLLYIFATVPSLEMQTDNPYDLRNLKVMMTWLNFESTLILAVAIVHLWIRFAPMPKDSPRD